MKYREKRPHPSVWLVWTEQSVLLTIHHGSFPHQRVRREGQKAVISNKHQWNRLQKQQWKKQSNPPHEPVGLF